MRCTTPVSTTGTLGITTPQLRRSTSLSPWQTKEGHHTGKQQEPYCEVQCLETPRMQFWRLPRGSLHSAQLEQLFMSPYICQIWQWLTRTLATLTMRGAALTRR